MSKAVLISINPKWCELIASGKKTIEVRKTRPKLETPFKCYIYQTKKRELNGNTYSDGKVIGEFVCKGIESFTTDYRMNREQTERISTLSCVGIFDLAEYECNGSSPCLFGWHISDLVIYDKPKELSEFYKNKTLSNDEYLETLYDGYKTYAEYLFTRAIRKPPQSWCYVEDLEGAD